MPELKVRVVNVVDLMALFQPEAHLRGMDETSFVDLFGRDTPVVCVSARGRRAATASH